MMRRDGRAIEKMGLVGEYRILAYDERGRLVYDSGYKRNLIVNGGRLNILDRLAGGAAHVGNGQLGVGNSNTAPAQTQTDLLGSNKVWKNISDKFVVTGTLKLFTEFGYGEANFTWHELGVKDNTGVMWSRVVDSSPFTKTSSVRAVLEWRYLL